MTDHKYRRFIVSERENGLGLSVIKKGATFRIEGGRTYYQVIDINALDAERARSARLMEALEFMTMPLRLGHHTVESLIETIANDTECGLKAIAEYKGSRD